MTHILLFNMKLLIYLVKGIQTINSKLVNTFRNYYYNDYLKLFGAKLSSGSVKFAGPCILQIQKGSDIQIGNNFRVNSGPRVGSDTLSASKITVLGGSKIDYR